MGKGDHRETRNFRRAAAALSFCLPGLGHLYAGARWRGFAINGAFLLLLSNASTRLLVPFVAAYAAWEAGRLTTDYAESLSLPGRWGLFAMGGGVGVFLWAVVVFGEITPFRAVERSREAVRRAAIECRRDGAFDAACIARFSDGWGRKLGPAAEDGAPRSWGRDGMSGTLDDVGLPLATSAPQVPGAFDVVEPR